MMSRIWTSHELQIVSVVAIISYTYVAFYKGVGSEARVYNASRLNTTVTQETIWSLWLKYVLFEVHDNYLKFVTHSWSSCHVWIRHELQIVSVVAATSYLYLVLYKCVIPETRVYGESHMNKSRTSNRLCDDCLITQMRHFYKYVKPEARVYDESHLNMSHIWMRHESHMNASWTSNSLFGLCLFVYICQCLLLQHIAKQIPEARV